MTDQQPASSAGRASAAAAAAEHAATEAEEAQESAEQAQETAEEARASAEVAADAEAREREQDLLVEHGVDPEDPRLDQAIRELEAGATTAEPYGQPGAPLPERSPLRAAMLATTGVLLIAGLTAAAWLARDILVVVLVAMFLATGLSPAVEWLRRVGLPHALAVATVVVVVVGIVAVTVLAGLPPLARQGSELREQLPRYTEQIVRSNPALRGLDERFGLLQRVEDVASGEGADMLEVDQPQVVLGMAMSVARTIFAVLAALVLTLYFLANFRGIKRAAYQLVPRSRRARVTLLTDEILDRVGLYVLGNLATSGIAGIVAAIALWVLGVPYAGALGLFVGLTDLIPLVGATIGAVVSCAVAFTVGPGAGVAAAVFFVLYQQFENFVLIPRVMRSAVDVSPAATIVAVLIGASLLGVIGALLAVPIAAALQLIATEVVMPRQEAR